MTESTAYLLLGSNLGDKRAYLQSAKKLIESRAMMLSKASAVYQSPTFGYDGGEDYLNQILIGTTHLSPHSLLEMLLSIENELGRTRPKDARYGPRTIDIDILMIDDIVVNDYGFNDLIIPHPRFHERASTLVPLCEIAHQKMHPLYRKTASELLAVCPDKSVVTRLE